MFKINHPSQAVVLAEGVIKERIVSTAELYIDDETVKEFIAETLADNSLFVMGNEGQEYGVCPFITFYIYSHNHGFRDEKLEIKYDEDFLPLSLEVIELHQELQTLIDIPYQRCYVSKTRNSVKATPEKLGRKLLQEHAQFAAKHGFKPFWIEATTEVSDGESARWAIAAHVDDCPWMRYTTVKITFRDKWYRTGNNRQIWHAFVQKWLQRLQPEQCYSGYEIGTTVAGPGYEADVMERICADYFYGLDVDHPGDMGFHGYGLDVMYEAFNKEEPMNISKEDFVKQINPARIGSGLRTPTWCFLLSPLWRKKLGKSLWEVKAALRHPDIHITEIPYKKETSTTRTANPRCGCNWAN
jgi:hypothetical protein